MKPHYLLAASAMVLVTSACGPKVPAARAALDCPASEGDLTRTSVSPDGKACTYATSDGAEVTLQLIPVRGDVGQTLGAIETTLLANRAKPTETPVTETTDEAAPAASETALAAARKAEAEAQADTKGVKVDVDIRIADRDGVTQSEDGTTRVELPGIRIVANEKDETAKIKVGPINIDAGGDGATVRIGPRDVRLRGEALNPQRRGMRAMFLYTGDDLPDGYRFVGYEAGGPKRGPITVAIVRSKDEGPQGDEIYPDVKRLVRLNGGV
jgi:hypothetical protein